LKQTEQHYIQWIDEEVRDSMGLTTESSYGELFSKYVTNVSHWVKSEKMLDPVSGQYRDPDKGFMGEIEAVLMSDGERSEDFRRAVISTIGARALENPSERPNYNEVFKHYIQRLREDFFSKRRKVLEHNIESFLKLTSDDKGIGLDAKDKAQAQAMRTSLMNKYGYTEGSARDTVAYLLKRKYST